MGREVLLQYSQESASILSHLNPAQILSSFLPAKVRSSKVASSPQIFRLKFCVNLSCVTCPAHVTIIDVMVLRKFSSEYKRWCS